MRRPDPILHTRRRAEIVRAALDRFVTQGFHRTTVQEIAADAGLSMGLLYRYFENKEGIVTEVARGDRAATVARIERFGASTRLGPAFVALMEDLITAAAEPGVLSLTSEIAAEACRNPAIESMVAAHEREIVEALFAALSRHEVAGRLSPDVRPRLLALQMLSLVDGLSWRVRLTPQGDIMAAVRWLARVVENPRVVAGQAPAVGRRRTRSSKP